jgi:hypothetical protein
LFSGSRTGDRNPAILAGKSRFGKTRAISSEFASREPAFSRCPEGRWG